MIHAQPSDPIASFLQMLAQPEHRRMLDLGRHDMALVRPRLEHTANRRVVALGAAAREDHFHRIGGADQRGDLRARLGDLLADLTAEAMDARRIAVKLGDKTAASPSNTSGTTLVVALLSK